MSEDKVGAVQNETGVSLEICSVCKHAHRRVGFCGYVDRSGPVIEPPCNCDVRDSRAEDHGDPNTWTDRTFADKVGATASGAGEAAEQASVSLEEMTCIACGHPVSSHKPGSYCSGGDFCGCQFAKLPKPQPAQAESAKVEKIFCRCGAEIENVGGPYWISVGISDHWHVPTKTSPEPQEPADPCTWTKDEPDGCMMCNGECCLLCGAGCWSGAKNCEHDVEDRHTYRKSPGPQQERPDLPRDQFAAMDEALLTGTARDALNERDVWKARADALEAELAALKADNAELFDKMKNAEAHEIMLEAELAALRASTTPSPTPGAEPAGATYKCLDDCTPAGCPTHAVTIRRMSSVNHFRFHEDGVEIYSINEERFRAMVAALETMARLEGEKRVVSNRRPD